MISQRLQRLLGTVLLNPEREHTFSELIRRAGSGRGATQAIVKNLLEAGIVMDRRVGNQRFFKANEKHPIFPELRAIAIKSFGVADVLKDALAPFGDRVQEAFVFGSFAKGSATHESDIDLMVVGEIDLLTLTEALAGAEHILGRPVHSNVYGTEEWNEMRRDRVVARIVDGPKIMVIDDEQGRDLQGPAGEPHTLAANQGR